MDSLGGTSGRWAATQKCANDLALDSLIVFYCGISAVVANIQLPVKISRLSLEMRLNVVCD